MTNEELVLLIQQGDRSLIGPLWERVHRFISMQAGRYLRKFEECGRPDYQEYVNDMTQDAFFVFLKAVERYDEEGGALFLTYLDYYLRSSFRSTMGIRSIKQREDPLKKSISLNLVIDEASGMTIEETIPFEESGYLDFLESEKWDSCRGYLRRSIDALKLPEAKLLLLTMLDRGCNLSTAANLSGLNYKYAHYIFNHKAKRELKRRLLSDPQWREQLEIDEIISASYRSTGLAAFKNRGFTSCVEAAAMNLIDPWIRRNVLLEVFEHDG